KNIVVRYLNIVNSPDEVAVEFKASSSNTGDCNCIAFHKEGYELDFPGSHLARNNFIFHTRTGIILERATTNNLVTGNIVTTSSLDGIALVEGSIGNTVTDNMTSSNSVNGINLGNGDNNTVTLNDVLNNAVAGIMVQGGTTGSSDNNTISDNNISGNGDGLTNAIKCVLGHGNTGNDVPAGSPCR